MLHFNEMDIIKIEWNFIYKKMVIQHKCDRRLMVEQKLDSNTHFIAIFSFECGLEHIHNNLAIFFSGDYVNRSISVVNYVYFECSS